MNKEIKESQIGGKLSRENETEILDNTLDTETGAVEGQVNEVAKSKSENSQPSIQQANGSRNISTDEDSTKNTRELLKERLLATAPTPRIMKQQIREKLVVRKDELSKQLKTVSKKDYYGYNVLLMQIRGVIREISELARLSLDSLKELWLRIVHNFA